MIHRISLKNYYSFKDRVDIDFVVDKNAPDIDSFYTDKYENRISKLMSVVGANASGKTNLLRSIAFLKWFITNSFSELGPEDHINKNFNHFLFCSERVPSEFELVFSVDKDIYKYELKLNSQLVFKEALYSKNPITKHFNIVFLRECSDDRVCKNNFQRLGVTSDFEKILRTNSSVISTANQIQNELAVKMVGYFSKIQSSFDDFERWGKNSPIFSASQFFYENPHMKKKAEKILRGFDLGINALSFQELVANDGQKFFLPLAHHTNNDGGDEIKLRLYEESGGTQNLFVLLRDILVALETGQIVVFDELDNNLHPLMVPEIVNLFRSENDNPKNAQILFSTHNPQILNELHKAQIVIVEKDERNISKAWKLSDIQGVRTDDNYVTK